MNVYVFTLACCLVAASALPADDQDWEFYKLKFNKKYNSDHEHKYRKQIFLKNKEKVLDHNAKYHAGLVGHSAGVNQFSDFGEVEFNSYASCLSMKGNLDSMKNKNYYNGSDVDMAALPKNVDWREKGAVTEVKDQGACGSCWAFSTTGALEGGHFMTTGKLVSLSEQNIIDCDKSVDTQGCNGGLMRSALKFVVQEGGIDTEESYPYLEGTAVNHPDRKCHYTKKDSGASFKKVVEVEDSEEAVMAAVATHGPLSIGFSVGGNFRQYKSGVYTDPYCDLAYFNINHGMVLVGYGETDDGEKYWIVKNSWASTWGDNGYINVRRGYGHNCGITMMATFVQ